VKKTIDERESTYYNGLVTLHIRCRLLTRTRKIMYDKMEEVDVKAV